MKIQLKQLSQQSEHSSIFRFQPKILVVVTQPPPPSSFAAAERQWKNFKCLAAENLNKHETLRLRKEMKINIIKLHLYRVLKVLSLSVCSDRCKLSVAVKRRELEMLCSFFTMKYGKSRRSEVASWELFERN